MALKARAASSAPPTPSRNSRYFDEVADHYFELYRERTQVGVAFQLRRQRVMELFDKPGGRVLDVGCGPGVFVDEFLKRGCTYFGIDHSSQMIAQCRTRFGSVPAAHFSVGSAETTGVCSESMDAVVCIGVLERHGDNERLLAELVRVLKPGGTLILTHSNVQSPFFLWQDFVYRPVGAGLHRLAALVTGRRLRPASPTHILRSGRQFAEDVSRHRCQVTDVVYSCFALLPPPLDRLFPRLAAGMMVRLEGLRHRSLRSLGTMIIVKAVRR